MQPKPSEYFRVFKSCFKILQNQLQLHDNCHSQAQPQLNSTSTQTTELGTTLLQLVFHFLMSIGGIGGVDDLWVLVVLVVGHVGGLVHVIDEIILE